MAHQRLGDEQIADADAVRIKVGDPRFNPGPALSPNPDLTPDAVRPNDTHPAPTLALAPSYLPLPLRRCAPPVTDLLSYIPLPAYRSIPLRQVTDLLKLAEMKWRYRVVDEGESPRDRAVELLEEAKSYVERHTASPPQGGTAEEYLRTSWAAEYSEARLGTALFHFTCRLHLVATRGCYI